MKLALILTALLLSIGLEAKTPMDKANLSAPLPANIWTEMARLTQPAVVGIHVDVNIRKSRSRYRRDPLFDFLEEFFGGGMQYQNPFKEEQESTPIGTGFVIDAEGYIVTNQHVVSAVEDPRLDVKLQVQLNGKSQRYDVTVVGSDERSDIALLKINQKVPNLPFLQFGDSDKVKVGEYVAAFGNPYGHSDSMTVGIVSAKGRTIKELNRFPFIQTDASINPGNSGGPLLNTDGFVIGVNSAIDARAQGIGFAIPANFVKKAVAIFKRGGTIQRGYLGVGLAPLHPSVARQYGIKRPGVIVARVEKGEAAANAGLKENDIIVGVNGKSIGDIESFIDTIQDFQLGTKVSLVVLRPTRQKFVEKKFLVTIGKYPDRRSEAIKIPVTGSFQGTPTQAPKQTKKRPKDLNGVFIPQNLGFATVDSSSRARRFFNVDIQAPFGPIVTQVKPGSPADRAGIKPGFIVLQVNNQGVNNSQDVTGKLRPGVNRFWMYADQSEKQFSLKAD